MCLVDAGPKTMSKYGKGWERYRKAALRRDAYLCVSCRQSGRITYAKEVDHIIRAADGGSNRVDNLQSLCGPCHSAKTRDENRGHSMACDANGLPLLDGHHWGRGRQISEG